MSEQYESMPIDTIEINIPKTLSLLCEQLAENVHEVWAKQRMEQGWTFGPARNDEKKEHPNLVPYESLTEEDKDYDRNTVNETVKMILKLGYKIIKE